MKRIKIFTLLTALSFGLTNFAQNLTLGLTGGYNATTYELFNFENPYNGWNLGLTGVWSSSEHWGIGGDILYTRIGGTYKQYSILTNSNIDYRVANDYVRVTPKFHYFFGDLEDRLRSTLFVGPSLGILTRTENFTQNAAWNDDFKAVALAGVVGGGVNYQISSGLWLHLNVNYTLGITSLNNSVIVDPDQLRTNSLGGSIGIAYSFNKMEKAVE